MNYDAIMYASVAVSTSELTNDELAALNLAIAFNNPNIKDTIGYEKVAHLFTENNGTKMHDMTLSAFSAVVTNRLVQR